MQIAEEDDFVLVPIQELEQRRQIQPNKTSNNDLLKIIGRSGNLSAKPVLCYQDSGYSEQRIVQNNRFFYVNHFFNAFSHAYTQHGDILLVPDQIWIMISFYLSRYIDENAQKLRSKLVKHEGVKKIQILQEYKTQEQSLLMQKNWDSFFHQVIIAIEKQTVNGVVQAFACDFSTTNNTYKTISTAIVMNSMKSLFKYTRRLGKACGINNLYMAGIRQDWAKMIPKLQHMVKYDVDGRLKQYIKHIRVILENFVKSFDNDPDVQWWNTIMTTRQKRRIYQGQILDVEGWIMHFFGIYDKTELRGFPEMNIQVPITLINEFTKKQKELLLVSDWVSVSKVGKRIYKPDVGLCIFEINQKIL